MTALAFISANWRALLAGGAILALAVALIIAKGDASHWSKIADSRDKQIAAMQLEASKQSAANDKRLSDASIAYAARLAAVEPVIVHSTNTVREYAQTPAGGALCLAPDRVRGIDDLDRSLADIAATSESAGTVRTDPGKAAGVR